MTSTCRPIVCLAALLLAATALAGCRSAPDVYKERVDALAAPYVDTGHVVGMSVGFIVDGRTYGYHYGQTVAGGGHCPDDRTLYEIGSISKTFTGLMLARGTLAGAWTLDDPVKNLLAGDCNLADGVTLRRLSTHTSGLPRMPHDFAPDSMTDPYVDYSREDMYETLRTIRMESLPGTQASYSNLAVGLLGDTMARDQGTTYEALLEEWVLNPLKMRATTVTLDPFQARRLAGPHNGAGEPDHRWDFDALAGAGAIRSTLPDMLRYAHAQLDPDSTPIAEAIRLTHERHTDPDGPSLGNGTGLGWIFLEAAIDEQGHATVIGHGGQTGGFHCFIGIDRAQGIALVVLTNTSNDYGSQLSLQIKQLLEGEDVEPVALEPKPEVYPVSEATLQRYVGRYQLAPEMVFTITTDGGNLYAELTGQPMLRVYPTSDTEFEYRQVEARIVFEVDDSGNATKLTLFQNGREMPAERIADGE